MTDRWIYDPIKNARYQEHHVATDVERFQRTMSDAFLPAIQAAAKSMATFAQKVNASLERAGQQMAEEAEKYANGERP